MQGCSSAVPPVLLERERAPDAVAGTGGETVAETGEGADGETGAGTCDDVGGETGGETGNGAGTDTVRAARREPTHCRSARMVCACVRACAWCMGGQDHSRSAV